MRGVHSPASRRTRPLGFLACRCQDGAHRRADARRDWGKHDPWPTFPKENEIDLTHMSRKVKEVIRAAGLRDELTFTSFRHGGFTEAANSDPTDAEIRTGAAQVRQGAAAVHQADHEAGGKGAKKRAPPARRGCVVRTGRHFFRRSNSPACQTLWQAAGGS